MSRKAIKSINWAALAERVAENEKTTFAIFKSRSEQFLRRMTANPEVAPKIDWAYYKRTVATPGLVDKFQKEYEALSIPYPADKYTAIIEAQEGESEQEIQKLTEEIDKYIAVSKKELEVLEQCMPYSEMTMEDFADMYPDKSFNREKPTVWPHLPEVQPEVVDNLPDEKH